MNQEENKIQYIRPQEINEYIGQEKLKKNLLIYMMAAKKRDESLDHVLLHGPAGTGKTTLAHVIKNYMGCGIITVAGPNIEKNGDLAAILSSLNEGDILFIDEIHRMPKAVEEILYQAMEDYELDIIISSDGKSKTIKLDLPPFTLIGATTLSGLISAPLRDRFGINFKLEYYTDEELSIIITRTASILGFDIEKKAAKQIAKRSQKTPRIANKYLKRIIDYACVNDINILSEKMVLKSLENMQIDSYGIDNISLKYLKILKNNFDSKPVGLETLSLALCEDAKTITEVIEPYLIQIGFINRTKSGRVITKSACEHLTKIEKKIMEDI